MSQSFQPAPQLTWFGKLKNTLLGNTPANDPFAEPTLPTPQPAPAAHNVPTTPENTSFNVTGSIKAPNINKALREAIPHVTANHIRKYLQDDYDIIGPSCACYRVDGLNFHASEANLPSLNAFFHKPEQQRIQLVKTLMRDTPGAKEMLDVSRLYFVKSIPASESLILTEAHAVMLWVDNLPVPLSIEIVGDYEERIAEALPTEAPIMATAPQTPSTASNPSIHPTHPPSPPSTSTTPDTAIDRYLRRTQQATPPDAAPQDDQRISTRLFSPAPAAHQRPHDDDAQRITTRLSEPSQFNKPQPLLILTLRTPTEPERQILLFETDLPLRVGRNMVGQHPSEVSEQAHDLVSEHHLDIVSYRPANRMLTLENPGRNGTWDSQSKKPLRFGYQIGQDQWLSLGGPLNTRGSMQIKLIAA